MYLFIHVKLCLLNNLSAQVVPFYVQMRDLYI